MWWFKTYPEECAGVRLSELFVLLVLSSEASDLALDHILGGRQVLHLDPSRERSTLGRSLHRMSAYLSDLLLDLVLELIVANVQITELLVALFMQRESKCTSTQQAVGPG